MFGLEIDNYGVHRARYVQAIDPLGNPFIQKVWERIETRLYGVSFSRVGLSD